MSEITAEEGAILIKFKEKLVDLNLSDILLHDNQLIRWLRARDLNLTKAEEMLRNNLQWRQEHYLDFSISISEEIKTEFPFHVVGKDRAGNPLAFCPYGKMDLKRGLSLYGKESRPIAHFYMEDLFQRIIKDGKRFSIIVDVEGLSYRQFSLEVLEFLFYNLQTFEKNYPETLATAFIVNAPTAWTILFQLGKQFLNRNTLDKVKMGNLEKMKKILQEYIDEENLPLIYK